MLTLQLGDPLGDHLPGGSGGEGDAGVRPEPHKSWGVTRMETPSKMTSARSKRQEAGAERDEDLEGGAVWGGRYIRQLAIWTDR